jgi:hypothetical protein
LAEACELRVSNITRTSHHLALLGVKRQAQRSPFVPDGGNIGGYCVERTTESEIVQTAKYKVAAK